MAAPNLFLHVTIKIFILAVLYAQISLGAVGEEYHESDTHHDNKEEYGNALVISVFILITLIIAVTVIFEEAKEHLLAQTSKYMRPILEQFFSEMTIFGFISLLSFVFYQSTMLHKISAKLFASDPHGDYVLPHALHEVHYLIFGVMILFLAETLYLLRVGLKSNGDWGEFNHMVQTQGWEEDLKDDMPKGIWRHPPLLYHNKAYKAFIFDSLRREFIQGRSAIPPFEPLPDQLPPNFDYSLYLTIVYGQTVSEILSLKKVTWFVVLLLGLVVMWIIASFNSMDSFVWIWGIFGWIGLFSQVLIYFKSKKILHKCINLKDFPPKLAEIVCPKEIKMRPGGLDGIGGPLWTYKEPRMTKNKLMQKLYGHNSSPLERCFWFDRNGPKFFVFLLQLHLIIQSIYITVVVYCAIKFPEMYGVGMVWLYILYSLTPAILVMTFVLNHTTRNIVHTSCIGSFRKQDVIASVLRHQKTARAVRALMVLNNLAIFAEELDLAEHELEEHDIDVENVDQSYAPKLINLEQSMKGLSMDEKLKVREIEKLFLKFDKNGDETVDKKELGAMMFALGNSLTPFQLDSLMKSIDRSGNGTIEKEEFLVWHIKHMKRSQNLTPRELANRLFKSFINVANNGKLKVKSKSDLIQEITNQIKVEKQRHQSFGSVPQGLTSTRDSLRSPLGPHQRYSYVQQLQTYEKNLALKENGTANSTPQTDKALKENGTTNSTPQTDDGDTGLKRKPFFYPGGELVRIKADWLSSSGIETDFTQVGSENSMGSNLQDSSRSMTQESALNSLVQTDADVGVQFSVKDHQLEHRPHALTIEQFQAGLECIDSGLNLKEIHDLIREIDENRDGLIDINEFADMLERYADFELPSKKNWAKQHIPSIHHRRRISSSNSQHLYAKKLVTKISY